MTEIHIEEPQPRPEPTPVLIVREPLPEEDIYLFMMETAERRPR